jgi:hypothetical protein
MSHITSRHLFDKHAQKPRAPRQRKPLSPHRVGFMRYQIASALGHLRRRIEKALERDVDLSEGKCFSARTAQVIALLVEQAKADLEDEARLMAEDEDEVELEVASEVASEAELEVVS